MGLFNAYPPMLTLHGYFDYKRKFQIGAELGYLSLPAKAFSASSSYFGVAGTYFVKKNYSLGATFGVRSFDITTTAAFKTEQEVVDIAWRRKLSQNILGVHFGYVSSGVKTISVLYLGVLFPFGTKFNILRDVTEIAGVPDSKLDEVATQKANDVKSVTNVAGVQLGFKYFWKIK